MRKLANEMQIRTSTLLQPTQTKKLESDCYVEGYATTWEPYELYEFDGIKYYEKIDRNALLEADFSDVIFQYDHSGKVYARNSNNTLLLEADDHGLLICADLSKSASARDMYDEILSGLVTRMSWAFIVSEDSYDRDTRTRTILKVKKVYDVSAVSIPANNQTEISARSFFEGVIEKEKREALERRRRQLKLKLLTEVQL